MTVLACSFTPVTGKAQSAQVEQGRRQFQIPPQPLSSALRQFMRQSGIQVSLPSSLAEGTKTSGAAGILTPADALSRLLAGSGLSYSWTAPTSVAIRANPTLTKSASTITLGPVRVSGGGEGGGGGRFDPNSIYSTPDSSAVVSREMLDRIPANATGDILRGLTGVIGTDNRVGGGFQPNIRGASGASRVKVIVDGTETTPSTYKGYAGSSDNNYVDPDLLAGFTVEKGVVADGGGAIGGVLRMRTLDAEDIVKPGHRWGVRIRGMMGTNSEDGGGFLKCRSDPTCTNYYQRRLTPDRIKDISGYNYSASIAAAGHVTDNLDLLFAFSNRQSGDYNAGKNGKILTFPASVENYNGYTLRHRAVNASAYGPGDEVWGTYRNSRSFLFKATYTPVEGHKIKFGFNSYQNQYVDRKTASPQSAGGLDDYPYPSDVNQKRYSLEYNWKPFDSRWINLNVTGWRVDSDEYRAFVKQNANTVTNGVRISNKSYLYFPWFTGLLTIDGQYKNEIVHAINHSTSSTSKRDVLYGKQETYGVHGDLSLPIRKWLTVHGGIRGDWYNTHRAENSTSQNWLGIQTADGTSVTGSGVTWNAGAVITPVKGFQIYGKYSTGWRAPTMREVILSNYNFTDSTLRNVSSIRPERLKSYEFGANYLVKNIISATDPFGARTDELGLKVSYFNNKYHDYIAGNGYLPGFFNARGALFRGVEFSLNYDRGWGYIQYGLTHYFKRDLCGYSLLGNIPGSTSSACVGVGPGQGLEVIAGYIPPTTKHDLTAGVRLLKKKLDLGFTMTKIDGFKFSDQATLTRKLNMASTTFNLFASYDYKGWAKINVSVDNLMDSYYFEPGTQMIAALPAPGRTVWVTVTGNF